MFLLGHLGIALGLAWLLTFRSSARVDYRLILLGSVLPDLIDKPLGIALGLETRIYGHTFVFLAAVLALGFVPRWASLRLLGFGAATHLLLDRIWDMPRIVLWPAYGWAFRPAPFDAGFWWDVIFMDPYVQAGEVLGAVVLIAFAATHRILSFRGLVGFLRHGTVVARTRESQP